MKKRLIAAFAFLLSGCLASVETDVEAYSALPPDVSGRTIAIAPFDGQSSNSLQWRTNAQILARSLAAKGMTVVSRPAQAEYVAYMGFAVDEGEIVETQYSIPQYGVTGYSGANTYGTSYGNSYSATTTFTPTYGVTGYTTGTNTEVVYTRSFALDIQDRRSGQQVFEGRAISRGECSAFAPVAPEIIGATLSEFPAGKVGSVSLERSGDC